MPIKRYFANADNTITNAYKQDLSIRGTGSNMGQSDILEVFSIYGQQSTSSGELSRALVQFNTNEISTDRSNGIIPVSGNVKFYLNLYNADHSFTLPRDYKMQVHAVSQEWEEGNGLDMDNYTDLTYDQIGSNWIRRKGSNSWSSRGGAYHIDTSSSFDATFENGNENLEVDVTQLVEQWLNSGGNVLGSKSNYGFLIKLSSSVDGTTGFEASSSLVQTASNSVVSYYTKKFFARNSEFFFKRPTIEARYESTIKDNRGSFFFSSSLATGPQNLNSIYLYNSVRGKLTNIPGIGTDGQIYVSIYSGSLDDTKPFGSALEMSVNDAETVRDGVLLCVTGGHVSTGIYSASFAFTGAVGLETIYDVWWTGSNAAPDADSATFQFHTGSISPKFIEASNNNPSGKYVVSMPNLKSAYSNTETERFRLYVREKNWSPNVFSKTVSTPQNLIIESASYQVSRVVDQKIVIPYGTSSTANNYSLLSYDVSGNYFDLDLSMLESGYTYAFQYSFYEDSVSSYREQPYLFKFRVEKDEY